MHMEALASVLLLRKARFRTTCLRGEIYFAYKQFELFMTFTMWQSPKGKRVLSHWASLLRWRWSISEYNLKTTDSPKRTLKSGPFVRERRRRGPAKQKPKHNPCRPVGRNWKIQKWPSDPVAGNHRHLDTECLARVNLIGWDPKGIPRRSMENMKWYSSSRVLTATHVSYPQLTAIYKILNQERKVHYKVRSQKACIHKPLWAIQQGIVIDNMV